MDTERGKLVEGLWGVVKTILPSEKPAGKRGRSAVSNRKALEVILMVLETGCRWRDVPKGYGSGTTCWRRLRDWQKEGVWEKVHQELLSKLNRRRKIDWEWSKLDSSIVPAVKGGTRQERIQQIGANTG